LRINRIGTSYPAVGVSKYVARQQTDQFTETQSVRLLALLQLHDAYRNRFAKPSGGLRSSSPAGRVFIEKELARGEGRRLVVKPDYSPVGLLGVDLNCDSIADTQVEMADGQPFGRASRQA